jgi:hypothetical protein
MFSFLQPIHFCCSPCHLLLSPPAATIYLQKKFRHDFTVTTLLAIQGSQTDKVLYDLSFCSPFFYLQLMKHYTFPNLSDSAQVFTAGFFQLISSVAETFVFIYMGMDIAIKQHSWSHVGFIFFSIVSSVMRTGPRRVD